MKFHFMNGTMRATSSKKKMTAILLGLTMTLAPYGMTSAEAAQAATVVADARDFAVDDLARAHDLAAEDLADGLVAEADAENRHPAAKFADDIFADARLLRDARPRRDDDARVMLRLDLGHCRLVMADDLDVRAKLRQQLVDVVGKGVVII